jgi:hypothetical protein
MVKYFHGGNKAASELYFDDEVYDAWRGTRLAKLHQILGDDFAKDKTILELGCGNGHVGLTLQGEGANVTFAEGRQIHLDPLLEVSPHAKTILIDQDKPYDLKTRFDLVIHWGVLYHLHNWQDDLRCALSHTHLMCLESQVADSSDPSYDYKISEPNHLDQALNYVGSRPSAAYIEAHLTSLGATFVRYDDSDLNCLPYHIYDWTVTGNLCFDRRRYWMVRI